jgi:hypothetical protein
MRRDERRGNRLEMRGCDRGGKVAVDALGVEYEMANDQGGGTQKEDAYK